MNTFTHFYHHLREWSLPWKITFKSNLTFIFSYAFHFLHNCSLEEANIGPNVVNTSVRLFTLFKLLYFLRQTFSNLIFPLPLLKLLKWILLLSVNFHSQDHRRDGGQGPGLLRENSIFAHLTVLTHTRHQHWHPLFCLACLVSTEKIWWILHSFNLFMFILLVFALSDEAPPTLLTLTVTFKNISNMNWNFFRLCLRIVIIL